MNKAFKSFLYIVACALVFIVLVKLYGGTLSSSGPANAFEWEKQVNIYLGNKTLGSLEDCEKVFPVSRVIVNAETLGPGALQSLIIGPSQGEEEEGYFTSLNKGVLIQKFEVKNGVAYADFDSSFNQAVGGSCRVTAIKSQIEKTLNELADIDSVVISVNGQTEGILEP